MDKKDEWEIGASRDMAPAKPDAGELDVFKMKTLVGQILDGRFLIEKDLTESGADQGGMGLVYLAQDLKLMSKRVVVKILSGAALKSKDIVRKFLHEKEALIRLDHPGIVRILDSGNLSDGNPFIVMEYIPGYSLRKKMSDDGPLPFETVAHIAESVTDALSAAHVAGIIHRDIKPENIMLTPQEDGRERVRLIDFGIARVEESKLAPATELPRGIGTILYISPEQLSGGAEPSPAMDIYSFAIVVHEMLTGRRPFEPQSQVEMFMLQTGGVQTRPGSLRPGITTSCEDLLLAALEFDPSARPTDIRAFGRELARELRAANEHPTRQFSAPGPTQASIAVDTDDVQTVDREAAVIADDYHAQIGAGKPKDKKGSLIPAIAAVVLIVLLLPLGYFGWRFVAGSGGDANSNSKSVTNGANNLPVNSNSTTVAGDRVMIGYSFTAQKYQNDVPVGDPTKTSGLDFLEKDSKYRIKFMSGAAGYLYVFSESGGSYNILFPTPKQNGGVADVTAGKPVETGWNTYDGNTSTETVWLIWSRERREDLEGARKSAYDDAGKVGSTDAAKLGDLIRSNRSAESRKGDDGAYVIEGKGELIVHRIELVVRK